MFAVLSHPLPPAIALPADVQTLFLACVDQAVSSPSAATIEPLYNLLRGTGTALIRLLSDAQLARFEEKLVGILRRGAGLPDQCVSLYCLAIMRAILDATTGPCGARIPLTNTSFETNDFLESTNPEIGSWRPTIIEQFLTGAKAAKSVQLIVLIVLAEMKSSGPAVREDGTRFTSLRLANEVLRAIPQPIRREWCAANAVTVGKLQEKVLVSALPELVKVLTLRFLGSLCGVEHLPGPVLHALVETFADVELVGMLRVHAPQADDGRLLHDLLKELPIAQVLRNTVEEVLKVESEQDLGNLQSVSSILERLLHEDARSEPIVRQVEVLRQDATFAGQLLQLQHVCSGSRTKITGASSVDSDMGICLHQFYTSRLQIIHLVSKLLLRTTLDLAYSTPASSNTTPPVQLIVDVLLDIHAQSAAALRQICQHRRSHRLPSMHYVEEHATPDDATRDWREALAQHFSLRARSEQAKIESIMANACADLEARCEGVEAPLREEREKNEMLITRNDELTTAIAELESRNVDLGIQNSVLEDESDRALRELEEAQRKAEASKQRILELERDSEQVRTTAAQNLDQMRQKHRRAELEQAASAARKQEMLERANERASRVECLLEQKNAMIVESEKRIAALKSEYSQLDTESKAQQEGLDQMLQKAKEEIMRAQTISDELKRSNRTLENDVEAAKTTIQTLEVAHDRAVEEISLLQHKISILENESATSRASYTSEINDHQQIITSLEQNLNAEKAQHDEAYAQLCADLDSKQATIAELQNRVRRLQSKCEQKDAQIADAEAMRSNLIAAMGLSTHALQTSSLPHRSRSSSLHKSQTQAQTLTDRSPPTPSPDLCQGQAQGDQDSGLSMTSFASTSSTDSPAGPTPKRARPRRSSTRAPMVAAPTPARFPRKSVAAKRLPLQGITGNEGRRSLRSAVKEPSTKIAHRKSAPAESSFGGSELFADTLGSGDIGDWNNGPVG